MMLNLFEAIVHFTNRNAPDIICSQGEFIPNPFKKLDKKTLNELFKKADAMNRGDFVDR